MTTAEIVARMREDLKNNITKVVSSDGYRYYTDTLTEKIIVPITTPDETALVYEKLIINAQEAKKIESKDLFGTLPRVMMFVGQPDTGKTYLAEQIAKECGITPLFKMCRDNLNLETLLEDFKLVDGKPMFEESLAIKMMSDPNKGKYILILDEFNTLLTGVMKTFQPIFDDTSTTFEYRGKIYNKNMNCKFIVTLNDKDKGISVVPDAILSRVELRWFDPTPTTTISNWTKVDIEWVNKLFDVYKILGLTSIFGTRQIKILNGKTSDKIKNHLYGLCKMTKTDPEILESLQMQDILTRL
jgi:adenylate kinase family enzyme